MEEALSSREPWLRELDLGVHPALAQLLFSLQQVREDIAKHTLGLTENQIWASALGFHLNHLAGSTDRLTTYLLGASLSDSQLADLAREKHPGPTLESMLQAIESAIQKADQAIRALDPTEFGSPRYIGRRRIPTTAIGLAIHIAEHAQRHTGQIITTCHVLAAIRQP